MEYSGLYCGSYFTRLFYEDEFVIRMQRGIDMMRLGLGNKEELDGVYNDAMEAWVYMVPICESINGNIVDWAAVSSIHTAIRFSNDGKYDDLLRALENCNYHDYKVDEFDPDRRIGSVYGTLVTDYFWDGIDKGTENASHDYAIAVMSSAMELRKMKIVEEHLKLGQVRK